MPLSRVAKREYMRLYMRRIRSNSAKLVRPGGDGESPYPLTGGNVRYLNRYEKENRKSAVIENKDVRPAPVRRLYHRYVAPSIWAMNALRMRAYMEHLRLGGMTVVAVEEATGELLETPTFSSAWILSPIRDVSVQQQLEGMRARIAQLETDLALHEATAGYELERERDGR